MEPHAWPLLSVQANKWHNMHMIKGSRNLKKMILCNKIKACENCDDKHFVSNTLRNIYGLSPLTDLFGWKCKYILSSAVSEWKLRFQNSKTKNTNAENTQKHKNSQFCYLLKKILTK